MARSRMRSWLIAAVAIAALAFGLLMARAAMATHVCATRDATLALLLRDWSEVPVAVGAAPGNLAVIELMVGPDGKTWTILQTTPDGVTCIVAVGTDWIVVAPIPIVGDPS